ncbi:DNA repair ATPase [Alphaproteobacteria bacterium KMM 3653]|uniref:DNA repair ATPase n=1 Tax=Harenicola maris TaxID=2841044 RepID=A0AAP2CRV6_9RHOB|nr:DNA repair ATPase [Harenicola maris]
MSNPVVLNNTSRIGLISAEADEEFLFECFVDSPALAELTQSNSPKMLLLGSTGAGKTAIIRKILHENDSSSLVQLDEMALGYLGNSDVINFLIGLDVNLDLFFQALWKHVILIEFIRLKFNVDNEEKSKFIFSQILNAFSRDQRKAKGLEYLRKWESKFWISMDENIKEITQNLEENVNAELGSEVAKFTGRAGYIRSLSTEKKTQLQRVARRFATPELLADLSKVIDTLAEHVTRVKPNFVLIDQLDENWIDTSIKYPMIRALIESLKSLRRISDLKTVVALRSDLLEKVILETKNAGFQSEKYEDYIVRLKWNSKELKSLVNKRINFLFRRKYSQENITFEDIFVEKVKNSSSPFAAILERTLYRPRDVINFVNMCLEQSEGKTFVSRRNFSLAEQSYSANRLTAMAEEWQNVILNADSVLNMLKGKKEIFELAELCSNDLLDQLVQHYPPDSQSKLDELWLLVNDAMSRNVEPFELACTLISRLHLMGAIGVKYDSNLPYQFFFRTQKPLPEMQLDFSTKIKIHPMLHAALGVIN